MECEFDSRSRHHRLNSLAFNLLVRRWGQTPDHVSSHRMLRSSNYLRFLVALPLVITLTARADDSSDTAGPATLEQRLQTALIARGPDYEPRTRHLHPDGSPLYINRLILEDSPYLLQHAHNPVDWYPWGPQAFAKARAENKPIFLSIGYSTCH
jgi:hypothetical protein